MRSSAEPKPHNAAFLINSHLSGPEHDLEADLVLGVPITELQILDQQLPKIENSAFLISFGRIDCMKYVVVGRAAGIDPEPHHGPLHAGIFDDDVTPESPGKIKGKRQLIGPKER